MFFFLRLLSFLDTDLALSLRILCFDEVCELNQLPRLVAHFALKYGLHARNGADGRDLQDDARDKKDRKPDGKAQNPSTRIGFAKVENFEIFLLRAQGVKLVQPT